MCYFFIHNVMVDTFVIRLTPMGIKRSKQKLCLMTSFGAVAKGKWKLLWAPDLLHNFENPKDEKPNGVMVATIWHKSPAMRVKYMK